MKILETELPGVLILEPRIFKDERGAFCETYNERAMISLAMVEIAHSEPGAEVTLVWGEEGGGSTKPTVERHAQAVIRATVAAAPYAEVARVAYRPK